MDIQLVDVGNNTIEVQLRPDADWDFQDGITNVTFTIRWLASEGGALGFADQVTWDPNFPVPPFCMSTGAACIESPDGELDDNGFRYQTYNTISGAAFPPQCFFAGNQWHTYARIPISGVTGCASFEIVNDGFTGANNKDFFVSLGVVGEVTGSILGGPVLNGTCSVDCEGTVGGSALPGTPCDDGNDCTVDDVYNGTAPNCGCSGTPVAAPTLDAFGSNAPICAGATLSLNASASGPGSITYSWTGPNGFSSNAQNPSILNATAAASGDYTVVASNGCDSDSETFSVTVTATSSNTTTISECDSYTWAVNGQTYTQSGTYTDVDGCDTEILELTITPSTSNTTTISECDSYTWAVNGQTYTQSGTYTDVDGCNTEILELTILQGGTNTTTVSECDSYTWAVDGQTYTVSGTYTSVTGCSTEILELTITPSTSNTTTISECASYTWPVNGQTYIQSGTYTDVDGCSTEILELTLTIPGTACDDGNSNTVDDTWDANCNCVGIPAGSELVTLEITLDDQGSETTWEIRDETGTQVIQSGGPYADGQGGTVITETFPLVQTCYELVVLDAGGNGIADGGYTLYDSQSRRIITANGLFGSVSQTANGTDFCLPLSGQSLISSWCDKTDLVYTSSTQIYASAQPGASGFQFWMFDPHGTYSRRVFSTTQNLKPTLLVTNPVPADLDLNVRVRALVGGNYTAFGQACVIRLNSGIGVAQMRDVVFNEGAATNFVLWPNPNRGEVIYLKLDGLGEEMQNITIDIHDMFGKRVFAQELDNRGDVFNHTIDLGSDLAPGLYLVNLRVNDMLFTQRMVRQ